MKKGAQKCLGERIYLGLKKSQWGSKQEFYRVESSQQSKAIEFLGGMDSRSKDQSRVQSE